MASEIPTSMLNPRSTIYLKKIMDLSIEDNTYVFIKDKILDGRALVICGLAINTKILTIKE